MEDDSCFTKAVVGEEVVQERDDAVPPLANALPFIYEIVHLFTKD